MPLTPGQLIDAVIEASREAGIRFFGYAAGDEPELNPATLHFSLGARMVQFSINPAELASHGVAGINYPLMIVCRARTALMRMREGYEQSQEKKVPQPECASDSPVPVVRQHLRS